MDFVAKVAEMSRGELMSIIIASLIFAGVVCVWLILLIDPYGFPSWFLLTAVPILAFGLFFCLTVAFKESPSPSATESPSPSAPSALLTDQVAVDELIHSCAQSADKHVYITVAPDNTATCKVASGDKIEPSDADGTGKESVPSTAPVLTVEEIALKEKELNERLFGALARK